MSNKATILVIGAGSVGVMAALALERGGQAEVTLVARSNYKSIVSEGLNISSVDHGDVKAWRPHRVCPSVQSAADKKPFEFIVIATKNVPDVPPLLTDIIAPAITLDQTGIVLLQNGLNIEVLFQQAFPKNVVISGISYIGAMDAGLATIRHNVHDELMVGPFVCPGVQAERIEQAARRFTDLYSSCKAITCVFQPDTRYWRWRKLLYNASFNSVAAISGLDVSSMRFSGHVIDELVRPIMLEIIAIAAADGVQLELDLVEKTIVVDPFEAFFLPSMAQDVAAGNLVEHENIVGEPLRVALRLGVPAPTLQVVYSLLKARQWSTMQRKGLITVPPTSTPEMKYG